MSERPPRSVGPDLVFGHLWQELGVGEVLKGLLSGRKWEFDVERAVYLTVLHRLFESGSDLRAERWRRDVDLPGDEAVSLHHLYRAMKWLGEVREEVGQKAHSKDHRPDRNQMVVGAVLDEEGRPVCSGQWPGNERDGAALMEVVDRTRQRFDLREVAWVTDRGMISAKTIRGLEERGLRYILGARMRAQKEVREDVLRSLVGNAGYRRVLGVERGSIRLDEHQITLESRFYGKSVLRTNTDLPASEVALQYQRLLHAECLYRAAKTTLATRPIYHPWDSTIHGHVFCSFLALILMDELQRRMTAKGCGASWDQVLKDLRSVCEVPVRKDDQWYALRTPLQGVAGQVLQVAGVAPPPPCRPCGAKAER